MSFVNEEGERRLGEAIEAIEARSRVEVVVVVRPSAGNYLGTDLLIGLAAGVAVLAFALYSSFEFALHWILLDVPLAIGTTVVGLRALPVLRAMFVTEARKRAEAEAEAAATFFRKGIRRTRERTGLLIYVATFEAQVVVLADDGVTSCVPESMWRDAVASLESVFHDEGDARMLAERIEGLGDLLGGCCPRRDDDVDELANAVDTAAEDAA